jgi:hypothetical protein
MLTLWEDDQGLRLRCKGGGKMRYAPTPDDLWLRFDSFSCGFEATEPTGSPPRALKRDEVREQVLAALPAKSMREVARKLDRAHNDNTLTMVWNELRKEDSIVCRDSLWVPPPPRRPLSDLDGGGTPSDGVAAPSAASPQNAISDYDEDDE